MKTHSPRASSTPPACSPRRSCGAGWTRSICRWVLYDRAVDPVLDVPGRRRIYLFWHEYVLHAARPSRAHERHDAAESASRRRRRCSRIAKHQGFGVVRGCTFDGASPSLRELIQVARNEPPDDHARRPARPAARHGRRADLPGVEARHADRADGLRLRSSLATRQLGPLRHPASLLARRAVLGPGDAHSRRSSIATASSTIASKSSG